MTPLQLLDFHKLRIKSPYIEGVLRYFREEIAVIRCQNEQLSPTIAYGN